MKLQDVMNPNQRFVAQIWIRSKNNNNLNAWSSGGVFYGATAQEAANSADSYIANARKQNQLTHDYSVVVAEFTQIVRPPELPKVELIPLS